jgi:hypothetical protein
VEAEMTPIQWLMVSELKRRGFQTTFSMHSEVCLLSPNAGELYVDEEGNLLAESISGIKSPLKMIDPDVLFD